MSKLPLFLFKSIKDFTSKKKVTCGQRGHFCNFVSNAKKLRSDQRNNFCNFTSSSQIREDSLSSENLLATDVVAARDGSLAESLLRILPRYCIIPRLGRTKKMGYGDRKINAAPVRNYRRTRARKPQKRSARACKRNSERRGASSGAPSRDPRLFEGFRSFRRGFNERTIESGSSRSPCLSTFSAADKCRPLKIFIAPRMWIGKSRSKKAYPRAHVRQEVCNYDSPNVTPTFLSVNSLHLLSLASRFPKECVRCIRKDSR